MSVARARDLLRRNEKQWEAYCREGNVVVLAGPGSGKTQVLTMRLVRALMEGVSAPRRCACITFSNEAVRELQLRLGALGIQRSDLFVGTIHSFALSQVLAPFGRIAGELPDTLKIAPTHVADQIYTRLADEVLGAGAGRHRPFKDGFTTYRRQHVHRDRREFVENEPQTAELIGRYEAELRDRGMIDFDDMIVIAQRLVESHAWVRAGLRAKYPFLAIDEYQDLGTNLHGVVVALANAGGIDLYAVGDPDQSIYGFQGARPELLRSLAARDDFHEVRLEINYRSRQRVIDAAEAALGEHRGYRTWSEGDAGIVEEKHVPGGLEGQAGVIFDEVVPSLLERGAARNRGEIALIYPSGHIGSVMAVAADERSFEYQRIDGEAIYRSTPLTRFLEDAARWCVGGWRETEPRLMELRAQWLALLDSRISSVEREACDRELCRFLHRRRGAEIRIVDWLVDFQGRGLLDRLDPLQPSATLGWDQLLAAAEREGGRLHGAQLGVLAGKRGAPDVINLITIHSAKGRQYDAVVIPGLEEGILPDYRSESAAAVAEDRRKFFVAISRARNEVHLLYSGYYTNRYGRTFQKGPSRFVAEVREVLDAATD